MLDNKRVIDYTKSLAMLERTKEGLELEKGDCEQCRCERKRGKLGFGI